MTCLPPVFFFTSVSHLYCFLYCVYTLEAQGQKCYFIVILNHILSRSVTTQHVMIFLHNVSPFTPILLILPDPQSFLSMSNFWPRHRRRSPQTTGSWEGWRAPPRLWKEIAPSRSMTWPCSTGRCLSQPSWAVGSDWGTWDLGPGHCPAAGRLHITEVSM